MNPVVQTPGRSFKGAAAYYLHDKRQPGEAERLTADRAAWTETVNLPTDDADRAWRMMADTAMSAPELKKAAGLKAGKPTTKPVFTYALTWHPDEKPDRAHQIECARETLKRLGMDHCQALIVAHNDTRHAHVHIIVNRINPENGTAAADGNSARTLQKWALEYQRERGQTYSPKREENAGKRERGEPYKADKRLPRAQFEAKRDAGNDNLSFEFVSVEQKQKDAQLYAIGRSMRTAHSRQWEELDRTYRTVKARLQGNVAQIKARKTVEIKEDAKGRWRDLFSQQRRERQAFEAAEGGTVSRLVNMAYTYQTMRKQDPEASALMIFCAMFSSVQRRATFAAVQEGERRDLSRQINGEIKEAHRVIDRAADRDFTKLRAQYGQQRSALMQTQDKQQAEYKAAWRARGTERRQALAPFKERAAQMRQGQNQGRGARTIRGDDQARRQNQPATPTKPRGP